MPERYQQGRLASPVVGTPGVDKSAGAAERQIAEMADTARTQQNQMTMGRLVQAEQNFNQASASFRQYAAEKKYQRRLDKAQQDENRRQQVQFDLIDENDRMGQHLESIKGNNNVNPMGAVEAYKNSIPTLRQAFYDRYKDDPKRMRMLMPNQRAMEQAGLRDVQTWAKSTTTANLNKRMMALPEEFTDKVNALSGDLKSQLAGFQNQLRLTNGVYTDLRSKALDQATYDDIQTKQRGFNFGAGKDFVNHVLAGMPDGEDGMTYLDTVGSVLKNPTAFGLPLSPEAHASFVSQVAKMKSDHENSVVIGVQGENAVKVMDANRLRNQLFLAADDPKQMTAIVSEVQNRLTALDQQVALVSKEPDSKIKNAKLMGLKQQQSALIGETGQEMKQQRSFDQLQRTLTTFAQSQVKYAQGQVAWQQGQMRFNQWLADINTKNENKAANEAQRAKIEAFNTDWAKGLNKLHSAWGLPVGDQQKKAVADIAHELMPKLNAAVTSGAITPQNYNSYLNQIESQVQNANMFKVTKPGWFGLGGGQKTVLNQKEKAAQIADAKAQFGKLAQSYQADFAGMQDSVKQMKSLTRSKSEEAAMTKYLHENMPTFMANPRYKTASPDQQAQLRARWVMGKMTSFRKGELK